MRGDYAVVALVFFLIAVCLALWIIADLFRNGNR